MNVGHSPGVWQGRKPGMRRELRRECDTNSPFQCQVQRIWDQAPQTLTATHRPGAPLGQRTPLITPRGCLQHKGGFSSPCPQVGRSVYR